MARMIQAFRIPASLSTAGVAVASLGQITLHGWNLTETGGAAGIVEFRTHIPGNGNAAYAPVVPVIGDSLLFERQIAINTSDSPWFSDHGLYLPGGLFVDLKTGSATILGTIWYS